MSTFALELTGATQHERIEGVRSFVGEDASGSFGIQAGHVRFMTALTLGLARFRSDSANWTYLALAGGLLYFKRNTLFIATRRYVTDNDYQRVSAALTQEIVREEDALREIKTSLRRLEEDMLKRIWQLGRHSGEPYGP